jgi:hypothetical protein
MRLLSVLVLLQLLLGTTEGISVVSNAFITMAVGLW